MQKDVKKIILSLLSKRSEVRVADIINKTGFSRAYINRFLQELKKDGVIVLIGKANNAHYVLAEKEGETKRKILSVRRILKNTALSEDFVLDDIRQNSGIFLNLPQNTSNIVNYAFTEMLNNAIEHSQSKIIEIQMERTLTDIQFEVRDWGIGIFNNIIKKRKLKNEFEAIQDLLKGKQTTLPKEHTGEGIFFTSKVGDMLTIQSSRKKLIFNNALDDIFIKEAKKTIGTKVNFRVALKSKRNLSGVFKEYSDKAFSFAKTETKVSLYKIDTDFISRSQARRVLTGLEKFKTIVLDFKNVETVGQGFADEVFRVWHNHHPHIKINYQNANENILFMIKRAVKK
jgi:anti-sigma regulatory factor (Ser/Thr protein kinase)/biotin operon repressor